MVSESRLKIVVSGENVGQFLTYFFQDSKFQDFVGEWVHPLYIGTTVLDLGKLKKVASLFDVEIKLRKDNEDMELP
jgi:hypothetical protein